MFHSAQTVHSVCLGSPTCFVRHRRIALAMALLLAGPIVGTSYAQYSPGTVPPDANDTLIVDFINRFRADPNGELGRLLDNATWSAGLTASSGPEADDGTMWSSGFWSSRAGGGGSSNVIAGSMDFFQVSPGDLFFQWDNLPSSGTLHPYTWNGNLGHSADLYNDDLVADNGASVNPHRVGFYDSNNMMDPDYWVNRFDDAGYTGWNALAENLFPNYATGNGLEYAHAGFAVDWGGDNPVGTGNGIQDPPGHRNSMLSSTYTEIGVDVQPNMMGGSTQTQHFGNRSVNRFLWGYVHNDLAMDGYNFDDALGGIVVEVLDELMNTVAMGSTNNYGGYAIDVAGLSNGATYTVDFLQGGNSIGTGSFVMNASTLREVSFAVVVPEPGTLSLLAILLAGFSGRLATFRKRQE